MMKMTPTREALLEKLVVSLHLKVAERKSLGSVSFGEIAAVVKRVLEQHGVFPPTAKAQQPGEMVFEGSFLAKRPDGRVRLVWQRSDPTNPARLAEKGGSEYDHVDEAVTRFIQREWSGGIDGIALSPSCEAQLLKSGDYTHDQIVSVIAMLRQLI